MARRLFGRWNAGAEEAPPSAVRKSDVWKDHHIPFRQRLSRQGVPINPRPIANLIMRERAVVRGAVEWVELSGFERADDGGLVDRDAGESEAAVGSAGKSVREEAGFHAQSSMRLIHESGFRETFLSGALVPAFILNSRFARLPSGKSLLRIARHRSA